MVCSSLTPTCVAMAVRVAQALETFKGERGTWISRFTQVFLLTCPHLFTPLHPHLRLVPCQDGRAHPHSLSSAFALFSLREEHGNRVVCYLILMSLHI